LLLVFDGSPSTPLQPVASGRGEKNPDLL